MEEKKAQRIPSLDLAWDWVKDVLEEQVKSAEFYSNKAIQIFSFATAVAGIAIPLRLKEPLQSIQFIPDSLSTLIALAAYILVSGFTLTLLWGKDLTLLRNPITMREDFWNLEPQDFKVQILTHMEDAFTENAKILRTKTWMLRGVIASSATEILFIILSLHPWL
ncbi:MAG: hypothetical protein Q7T26_03700 [Dehalococcoidia bacterium]|nr:hypothetical protein [Dehalococcoidia bacterium]